MIKAKHAYTVLTALLSLAAVYLYAKGMRLKPVSFGLGLSYVLPAVACLGLSIVSGIMALLESADSKRTRPAPAQVQAPKPEFNSCRLRCVSSRSP